MRRVGGWLGTRVGSASSRSMTALDEPAALQEAMASAALIMNDEVERAENELSKGTSPFHKLGRATTLFLRATLGFEKEVMEQAGARLAEAEEAALEYQRRASRDPSTAHHSKIYPVGAEYALCHAETQLMSAVVAVLNESLTESLRGFYKLRKAFNTLHEISEAERHYLQRNGHTVASRDGTTESAPATPADSSGVLTPKSTGSGGSGDDDGFVDAEEGPSTASGPNGHPGEPEMDRLVLEEKITEKLNGSLSSPHEPSGVNADSKTAATEAETDVDFRTITSDPIDIFVHSGTSLCYGLLQLLLSIIPPAFARLLSLFSFRGNREAGLRMLWSATKFKNNIKGAMAGLIYLGFHNGAVALCDIITKDALPEARLRSLLREMRELYPKSKLWLLEEARMLSADRQPEKAVELIRNGSSSSLKQAEALCLFEMSLNLMYLHRYEECAENFIKCVGLNNWSHGMYYYIAGSCHVELYRIHKTNDPEKAARYAAKAEKYLREVPAHTGKKRFMARQLPFDVFVNRKLTKWDARAKARGCDFIDAIGVSPVVEMAYFWSGMRRMRAEQLNGCLERLAWSENTELNPSWEHEAADERAVLNLLRGCCQRFLGQIEEAKATLEKHVLSHDLAQLKSCEHPDTWALPVAHYEKAVCLWQEAGGEDGEKEILDKCSEEISKVEKWESFELEARLGLKVATARQTLRKISAKHTP